MWRLRAFLIERGGAAAAEMALVLPGVLFLMLGGGNLILLLYASVGLNSAAEAAARYASVQTAAAVAADTVPSFTESDIENYAAAVYKGPGMSPLNFKYSTTGKCGGGNYLLVASGTYHLYYGFGWLPIQLTNQSCFP
jgi:Flp pilus assembly protein TadG